MKDMHEIIKFRSKIDVAYMAAYYHWVVYIVTYKEVA